MNHEADQEQKNLSPLHLDKDEDWTAGWRQVGGGLEIMP